MEKTEQYGIRRFSFKAFGDHIDIWALPRKDRESSREQIRNILSELYKEPEIQINTNSHGKPYSPQLSNEGFFFNYSHSHKMILLVTSANPYVGIDLEYLYQPLDLESLANTCLTETESKTISSFHNKIELILTYWTRKEAILKAKEVGHTVNLKKINIPIYSVQKLTTYFDQEWLLKTLTPAFGYIASVAVKKYA